MSQSNQYSQYIADSALPTKANGNVVPGATQLKSTRVAITEPDGIDLTREGRRFAISQLGAVTGIAPVQAQVTTAAQWVLWNADPAKTYYLEHLGVHLVSGTAGAGIVVVACLFTLPAQTGLVANAAIQNLSNSSKGSSASVKSGVTITAPAAPNWFPVATNPNANTAVLNTEAVNRELRGRIAIQPGQGLGLAVYSPTGTSPLFAPVAQWVELESAMG